MITRYDSISVDINIHSIDHNEWARNISQKSTKFSYEKFIDDIQKYLIEKEEDENHITTIIYLLSLEEENVLTKINDLFFN